MQQVHLLVQQEEMEVREQGVLVLVGQVVLAMKEAIAHQKVTTGVLVRRMQPHRGVQTQEVVVVQGQLVVVDLLGSGIQVVQVVLVLLMTLQAHR